MVSKILGIKGSNNRVWFVCKFFHWIPLKNCYLKCSNRCAGRHVDPHKLMILILRQALFAVTPLSCMLSGEASKTTIIVFGLTWLWYEHLIYYTWDERANHYVTDAVIIRNNTKYTYDVLNINVSRSQRTLMLFFSVFINLNNNHLLYL